ncbi:KCTD16 [Cervus elaphus hippelaphus]|uniref:KCTD16 n=1 Tax=Cervus elaphus hippelaphus TaxID=46360 RepID=A0A212D1T3_CEREH|nr:KCTD16 [Cervus elaphus hippelaphus]
MGARLPLPAGSNGTAHGAHLATVGPWRELVWGPAPTLPGDLSAVSSSRLRSMKWGFALKPERHGEPSRWSSSHCDCCCKNGKGDKEGESGTSCNDLSTSSCDSQSEASSPQETVICGPVTRQTNIQTLDRPIKKGPVQLIQQSEMRRKNPK